MRGVSFLPHLFEFFRSFAKSRERILLGLFERGKRGVEVGERGGALFREFFRGRESLSLADRRKIAT